MYLLLSQRGPAAARVGAERTGRPWGERDPGCSGISREKGRALQFGRGMGPSSPLPSPHVLMSLIHGSFISRTHL